jgi:hypothetical protein
MERREKEGENMEKRGEANRGAREGARERACAGERTWMDTVKRGRCQGALFNGGESP